MSRDIDYSFEKTLIFGKDQASFIVIINPGTILKSIKFINSKFPFFITGRFCTILNLYDTFIQNKIKKKRIKTLNCNEELLFIFS